MPVKALYNSTVTNILPLIPHRYLSLNELLTKAKSRLFVGIY
jgi:hypothetical protein